jgi:predicted protein tyrosine phosphatase
LPLGAVRAGDGTDCFEGGDFEGVSILSLYRIDRRQSKKREPQHGHNLCLIARFHVSVSLIHDRFTSRADQANMPIMKVLFVCTANKLRSPTAEDLFRAMDGIEARSAGTDPDCPNPLTADLVAWAELIVTMENHHREHIRKKFKKDRPADNRIITLFIPDEYERDDPVLIDLLREKAWERIEHLRDSIAAG